MSGRQDDPSAGGGTPSAATAMNQRPRELEFYGTWDTVRAEVQAYPGNIRAYGFITFCDPSPELFDQEGSARITGTLSEILASSRRWTSFVCHVELIFFYPSAPESPRSIRGMGGIPPLEAYTNQYRGANAIVQPSPNHCGNCGSTAHRAAVCVVVDQRGWMHACPKCDSRLHSYAYCPRRRQAEDFHYLIVNRGNRGAVRCTLTLGLVVLRELRRPNTVYRDTDVIPLPHSSEFARLVRDIPVAAKLPMMLDDGRIIMPERHNQSLGNAAAVLEGQRWERPSVGDYQLINDDDECEVCSGKHVLSQCPCPCGFCGSFSHHTMFCPDFDQACICAKYPGHKFDECTRRCWYCSDVLRIDDGHTSLRCPLVCHICFASDHVTRQCDQRPRTRLCPRCPGEECHWPLIHVVCPGKRCTRLIATQPCEDHCRDCG
ncbi:hypothetical protein F5Y08DRAFT_120425 [Xylaria arbuscula]|nr:hypothetical protein F5Y08DRAFT_120425 [Xylaria arbuscula]